MQKISELLAFINAAPESQNIFWHFIEQNYVSADQVNGLQSRIDDLSALYRDVKPGDRYALTYIPDKGTTLSLNGKSLGSIPGDDFARAVFAIWLGDNPIDQKFRDQLLKDS